MPTIPAAFGPMIDEYMKATGQTSDTPATQRPVTVNRFPDEKKPGTKEYVAFAHNPAGVWTIPVWLESEANNRDHKGKEMSRKAAVKRAVWKAMGPHWKAWGPVGDAIREAQATPAGATGFPVPRSLPSIRLVRLGGRGLDTANLWRAVKPAEDALAVLLGCDDGWNAWKNSFYVDQEPGRLWGLRVEITPPSSTASGPVTLG